MIEQVQLPIEDDDILFYRIPKSIFKPDFNFNEIPPMAFNPQGDYLSTNWQKFCPTALDCLEIKTTNYPNGKTSKTHGVGHFVCGEIRSLKFLQINLEVKHVVPSSHYSHAGVFNLPPRNLKAELVEMRFKLRGIFNKWDIAPEHKEN